MFAEKLSKSLSAIEDASIKEASNMVGIDANAIAEIEEGIKLSLPETYKLFLERCGSGENRFLIDNGFILYPRLIEYKAEVLQEAEDEGESIALLESSVVFKTYQGEDFWFFNCEGVHDPEVFYAEWGENEPERTDFRLSDFLVSFFSKAVVEKQGAERFSCLYLVEDYAYGKTDSLEQLSLAITDINNNLDLFKKPLIEMVLVDNLLRCLGRLDANDVVSQSVLDLLGKLNVKEAQIAIVLEQNKSDLGIRFLAEFARMNNINDDLLKKLLAIRTPTIS
jgi:hypothetical protein